MATPKKTPQGTWRIQLEIQGVRDSGTFPTKRDAEAWAQQRATEIRAMASGKAGTVKTLRDALRRYAEEVSPTKRGEAKEIIRLKAFEKQALPLTKTLDNLTTADLAAWRDSRLAVNARGSVLRDMTLLGSVIEVARREWGWIKTNPMRDVKRPQNPDHRQRVINGREIRGVLRSLGHGRGKTLTVSQAVARCFLVALATGMRAGELCAIQWADVKPDHVRLHTSKTGVARDVPLSGYAKRTIERMRGWDDKSVFGLQPQTLDSLFRRARERAGLSGFTFHDARHSAATRIAQKLHVLDLCRMFGWKRVDQAMTYYQPRASDVARRL
ncbi:tyrosine-type recombinase/integrase [Hydrogenophaga crocea]|uniref:Site-specific integrase n=1 Tax=Hydrogenophaga crocea TaxID=2716225 RepID=A0A6G8IF20_9BURK|nr:site-specific integrase [Hydrogenophaga crocea]QIM51580.1 site-specific integrase [Hydrogenophaga crocea]